jgi:hypothetical protein
MGRLTGKVASVTGAARGRRRVHTVRLAVEGDIVAVYLLEGVPYPPAWLVSDEPRGVAATVQFPDAGALALFKPGQAEV